MEESTKAIPTHRGHLRTVDTVTIRLERMNSAIEDLHTHMSAFMARVDGLLAAERAARRTLEAQMAGLQRQHDLLADELARIQRI